jgi:Phytanoyl-CoA dioxygenase (PhyH)
VDELADSAGLLGDPARLRNRLAADGYLFFRGLLAAERIRAAGDAVRQRLRSGGWTDGDGTPSSRPRAPDPRDALRDPAFRAALLSAEFNQIPYLAPLRSTIRAVLGPLAFSYPVKVLRAVYPERPGAVARGRYVHYDYAVGGGQDMLTTWLPLMDIPVRLGGLAVQPGGQHRPPQRPRQLTGAEPGWATTSYRPGDAIVFHCLTPHAALPNTASALRISGDFRWQLPTTPAPSEMVLGPARVARQHELYLRLFCGTRWWEPVPDGLTLRPREELAAIPPGPSRFFPVHPGWQAWQPPPPAVH